MASADADIYSVSTSSSSPRMRRKPSYRALGSFSSPPRPLGSAVKFFLESSSSYEEEEEKPHQRSSDFALDACSLCGKRFDGDSEVYMYRGDTPFCSDDCRTERIEMDEAEQRMLNSYCRMRRRSHDRLLLQNSTAAAGRSEQPPTSEVHVRPKGTVVVG